MTRKIKFTDLTLRDGQQSLAATRMTTEQALRVLPLIDKAGFETIELWGGAVLDSCVRFLNENPWERLETFAACLGGSTKIQALLRGQNLFAYQPYPDDLVIAFIKEAVRSGVGVMRIFDALNDWRNLQIALLASKAYGAKVEAAMSYTVSPVHTVGYYVDFARKLESEGADQIALKDMAGLLHPSDALRLVRSLKRSCSLPITMHSHTTTGVGLLNLVVAMYAGADAVDSTITPFAGGTSHSPVEVLIVFAEEMGLEHGLDKELVLQAQAKLFEIQEELKDTNPYYGKYYRPVHYDDVDRNVVNRILDLIEQAEDPAMEEALSLSQQLLVNLGYPEHDDRIFKAQIPGGMLTNLQNQLKQMGQLDMLDKVMQEVPLVREDVGFVPLVTPTSQIVASQAAFNVMYGARYSFVSNEFRMLLRGEFGRTPVPPKPEIVKQILGDREKPRPYRPASYLKPLMEDDYRLPFVRSQKDLLLHLMLGKAADDFLQRPPSVKVDLNEFADRMEG